MVVYLCASVWCGEPVWEILISDNDKKILSTRFPFSSQSANDEISNPHVFLFDVNLQIMKKELTHILCYLYGANLQMMKSVTVEPKNVDDCQPGP